MVAIAGCGVPSLPTMQIETIDAAAMPAGQAAGAAGARVPPAASSSRASPGSMTMARWPAPAERLAVDITRAVKRNEWAVLHQKPPVEVNGAGPPHAGSALTVSVLLPDDREGTILAWRLGENEVAVALRVGYFGDPAAERQFLALLREVMAGKPKPKRGGKFELP